MSFLEESACHKTTIMAQTDINISFFPVNINLRRLKLTILPVSFYFYLMQV